MKFDEAPLLAIWETTQACDLACAHCRASARPGRAPAELTTEEGYRLLDRIRAFGNPILVLTGGDPLKRPDLFLLIRRSVELGLRTNVSPSATPLLTREIVRKFQSCGVARMAISVDGPDATSHDRFRSAPGTFTCAAEALEEARAIGLKTQVQTMLTRRNMHQLDEIAALVQGWQARMWSVFFLVATGRASAGDDLSGEEYEQVFEKLYRISKRASFEVKTTEAMHYRRFLARRAKLEPGAAERAAWRTAGVNDGRGFIFISHTGDINPSGFLPLCAGNVRRDSLADIYRHSPLFRALRDTDRLHGKCGVCEYRKICGGSRARAYALTGDFLAEDPRCIYQPGDVAECSAVGEITH